MKTESQNNGIFVLAPVVKSYTFAKPFRGNDAQEVYKAVKGRIARDFKDDAPKFNGYFEFNEETGEINGSSLYHGVLINDELRQVGLWFPTFVEGRQLDKAGKLSNGVYRDYGVIVYDETTPNSNVAKKLVAESKKKNWNLPVIAPFKSLTLGNGAIIGFNQNTQDLVTGDEAVQYLKDNFNYVGDSGVQRLYLGRNGYWDANLNGLVYSDDYGRVDWVCGEATQKNLESAVLSEVDEIGRKELEQVKEKISKARESALTVLRS